MTKTIPTAKPWFVNGPAKSTRTADTLPPDLMELARKRGIGARIKQARERSKWTQPQVAEHLGIGLRAYQKMEQVGTSSFQRCEDLADFLEVPDVTADYLWGGMDEQLPADPLEALSAPASAADLGEIRERLQWIEDALAALAAVQGLELDARPSEQDRPQQSGSSGSAQGN